MTVHYYAQLNEDNCCVGVSQLSAVSDAPNMIMIDEETYAVGDLIGRSYADGAWGEKTSESEE